METAHLQPTNRREALYYLWAASIILILGLLIGLLVWFMQKPLIVSNKIVAIELAKIPPKGATVGIPEGRFFLSHTDNDALIALQGREPRFGCFVKWVTTNQRFEESCHGYKFELDGTYIEGMPAPHDLNRYFMTITFTDGQSISSNESGDPIPVQGRAIAAVTVDVCRLIEGKRYLINDAAYSAYITRVRNCAAD